MSKKIESSIVNADGLGTKELEAMQWSGLRHNFLIGKLELWVGGRIAKELFLVDVERNPALIATAFEEVFGLTAHVIETDVPGLRNIH